MVRSPIPTSCLQYLCAYMCVCRCVCICAYVNVYMCGDSVTLLSSFLLSSSSIGMTKAALEAMDGMNLFGEQGSLVSIIHVDPDAQYRNSVILNNLLPKESSSKETDASLLCISGYPAFAIDDPALRKKTEAKVKELLEVGIVHVTNFSIRYPSEFPAKDGHLWTPSPLTNRILYLVHIMEGDTWECLPFFHLTLLMKPDLSSLPPPSVLQVIKTGGGKGLQAS